MRYLREYHDTIWTNHALRRLKERAISQSDAYYAFRHPASKRYSKTKDAWIYQATINNHSLEIVAKENAQRKWLILSVWYNH